MNVYLIIAGVIGVAGGLAHTILGHRWTVAPLDPDKVGSPQNTGDQNKRYLMWFWHIGSVILLSTSALALLHGLGQFDIHRQVLMYVSFLWLSISALFFVIASKPPVQYVKMVPGLVGIPVNLLILAGLFL